MCVHVYVINIFHQTLHSYVCVGTFVGLTRTMYIRCIYSIFGREITKYTVIYGVYIRFWPTLDICKPLV